MRLIACSDAHLDWSTAGSPRFDDVRLALRKVANHAIAVRADAFLFLGDLCDPDRAPEKVPRCIAAAVEDALRLSAAGVENHWLAGNHDVIEDGSGTTVLEPLKRVAEWVPGIRVYDRPGRHPLAKGRASLFALPFTASSHGYDPALAYVASRAPLGLAEVVIGHLNIPGAVPGSETAEMPRGREVVFPKDEVAENRATLVLHGHYHKQQLFEGIHIPGSLVRLTFGEENNRPSFLDIEVPDAS